MIIFCDNNSTIQLSKNPVLHGRRNHIDVKFHFLRDLTKDEMIEIIYCKRWSHWYIHQISKIGNACEA
jgi:hypothetical protein